MCVCVCVCTRCIEVPKFIFFLNEKLQKDSTFIQNVKSSLYSYTCVGTFPVQRIIILY